MKQITIELLIAGPVILIWLTVVSGIARVFGIRIPLAPFSRERKSALESLTWVEKLYKPEIKANLDKLYKKPGYDEKDL